MMKIDIFGSCVSRDILTFDKNNDFEENTYIARSSILSNLQDLSWNVEEKSLLLDSKFQRKAVLRDLNKTVYDDLSSKGKQSDYLLIDFIDERFRILKYGDKYATYSPELMNSKFMESKEFELLDKIPKIFGYGYTFKGEDIESYIKKFADKIKTIYAEEQIIVHEAYMCEEYIDEKGARRMFKPNILNDVRRKNLMLRYMYETLENIIPKAHTMKLFDYNTVAAYEKHVWGLAPMHYEDEYYRKALKTLLLIRDGKEETIRHLLLERKNSLDQFVASDVKVYISDNTVMAINNFQSQSGSIRYSWYINEIEADGKMVNVYKSSQWTEDNEFKYTFKESEKKEFLLIGYVKFTDDEKRTSRIITNIKTNATNELILTGHTLDEITKQDIYVESDDEKFALNVKFEACGPVKYAWYVFENDFNNVIYKSDSFSESNDFVYIPSNVESTYFFQVYLQDALGYKKYVRTDGLKIAGGGYRKSKFGINLYEFNCDMALPDDETNVLWANRILNDQLYVHKHFNEAISIKDGINWEIQFTESPGTYQLWLQSLGTIAILSRAYLLKGEIRYLQKANEILLSWIEYERSYIAKDNSMIWHDHVSALRSNSIIYFALVSENAGLLDDASVEFIKTLVMKHAEFLSMDSKYTRNHNHGVFQDQSLIYCAYFLDDDNSEYMLRTAKKRLQEQVEFAFNDETVHVENSSAYHIAMLYMLEVIAKFLENKKDYFGYYLKAIIKKSADFCTYLNRPSGNLINTGDSSIGNKEIRVEMGAEILENDMYLYSATQGKKGRKPEKTSIIYPKSGYYFYKQDSDLCGNFDDATWKMFKSGYSCKTHKHADDLSFAMYSKGYDIFVDTGYYNYNPGNIFCDYFKSAMAHNSVTVDSSSYSVESENAYKVGIYEYTLGANIDYIVGYNNMYWGVSIDRHFFSAEDVTAIYDNIISEENHTYKQIFHLSEHIKILNYDNKEILMQIADKDYFVRVRQLGGSCDLEIIEGKKNIEKDSHVVIGGYISYGQNQITPTKTLQFSAYGKCFDFVTLITIEDNNGHVICSRKNERDREKSDYKNFYYNKENKCLIFAGQEIQLQPRKRRSVDSISVSVKGNKLSVKDSSINENEFEYEYEIIDYKTGLIIYKKNYSIDDAFEHELPLKDVLIKSKMRIRERDFSKKIISYIKYDVKTGKHRIDEKTYPYLNLRYRGHRLEKVGNKKYRFIVDVDYSLGYKIRWYIYRNGAYYTVQMTENSNIFEYEFKAPGDYTVSYYIITNFGEKQMYNFKTIAIKE